MWHYATPNSAARIYTVNLCWALPFHIIPKRELSLVVLTKVFLLPSPFAKRQSLLIGIRTLGSLWASALSRIAAWERPQSQALRCFSQDREWNKEITITATKIGTVLSNRRADEIGFHGELFILQLQTISLNQKILTHMSDVRYVWTSIEEVEKMYMFHSHADERLCAQCLCKFSDTSLLCHFLW